MKKVYLVFKRIWQCFLYLVEVLGIAYLLTWLSIKVSPCNTWFDYVERVTIFYALYQMIIIGIFTQLNDIEKDEYLAITTAYKYLLEITTDLEKQNLLQQINKELEDNCLNDLNIRNDYQDIKYILESNEKVDIHKVNMKIIHYEHKQELALLNWRYSILLRIMK